MGRGTPGPGRGIEESRVAHLRMAHRAAPKTGLVAWEPARYRIGGSKPCSHQVSLIVIPAKNKPPSELHGGRVRQLSGLLETRD
jgi:hypothetical protein